MLRLVALFTTLFVAGCSHLTPPPAVAKPKGPATFTVSFSIDRDRLDEETLESLEKVAAVLGSRGQVKSTHLFTVARKAPGLSYGEGFKGTRGAVAQSTTESAPLFVSHRR